MATSGSTPWHSWQWAASGCIRSVARSRAHPFSLSTIKGCRRLCTVHTKGPKEDPLVDMGFETRDLNYSAIGKTAAGFFIFGILCFAAIAAYFVVVKPQIKSELDPHKPLPGIMLQTNMTVRTDIQEFRQAETQKLSTYAKNQDGSYLIPIDKAMDLVAQRGL